MTNRQIVLEEIPDAKLEYHVTGGVNCSMRQWYTINTVAKTLSKSTTREGAWKLAKRQLKNKKP